MSRILKTFSLFIIFFIFNFSSENKISNYRFNFYIFMLCVNNLESCRYNYIISTDNKVIKIIKPFCLFSKYFCHFFYYWRMALDSSIRTIEKFYHLFICEQNMECFNYLSVEYKIEDSVFC